MSALWLPLLVLLVPLVGGAALLVLKRWLSPAVVTAIAGSLLLLIAAGVVALGLGGNSSPLAQALPQPQSGLREAPTVMWVQPPRTLTLQPSPVVTATRTLTPTATATPNPIASVTVSVRNGTARPGLAGRTAERLRQQGFQIVEVENDPQAGNRPHTLLLDRGDHPEVRQALAELLGIGPEYIVVNSDEPAPADIVIVLGDDFQE